MYRGSALQRLQGLQSLKAVHNKDLSSMDSSRGSAAGDSLVGEDGSLFNVSELLKDNALLKDPGALDLRMLERET